VQQARERPLPHFLGKDPGGVGVGFAGVHDQRQPCLPRRGDVHAEAPLLRLGRAVQVVVVEAGLAEADHLRVLRQPQQRFR
jgi:hypothetical protein